MAPSISRAVFHSSSPTRGRNTSALASAHPISTE